MDLDVGNGCRRSSSITNSLAIFRKSLDSCYRISKIAKVDSVLCHKALCHERYCLLHLCY